jgi:hypothetical protein
LWGFIQHRAELLEFSPVVAEGEVKSVFYDSKGRKSAFESGGK